MNMEYQDLSLSKSRTIKMYMQNPNRSISSTFCNLRNKSYNSSIGDYPLLYAIINTLLDLSINFNRSKVNYALNKSQELKQFSKVEKNELLNQLVKHPYVQMKQSKNAPQSTRRQKMNSLSI